MTKRALPRISIVVPSLNQGGYLADALDSIFRQGYPHLEVLVMDGGSTDESVRIIRSYESRLTYWQSQPDRGQSEAINEGVRRSRGTLVAWLNSDDFYWGDTLWTVARAYAALPDYGLYIGNGLRYDATAGRYRPFCRRHLALNREALARGLDYILQPSVFFLRRAWDEVGGLNPELRFCMDWDLLLRIGKRESAVLVNDFLAVSREYMETKTKIGGMSRAFEIDRMVRLHTGEEVTPGSLYYVLETLLDVTDGAELQELRHHVYQGMKVLQGIFAREFGNVDGFPERGDPRDQVYLPFPGGWRKCYADLHRFRHRRWPSLVSRPFFHRVRDSIACYTVIVRAHWHHWWIRSLLLRPFGS